MKSKGKLSTLLLGIALILLAVGVIIFGSAVGHTYEATGTVGLSLGETVIPLSLILQVLSLVLLAGSAAVMVTALVKRNRRQLPMALILILAAYLVYIVCTVIYRQMDHQAYDFNLRLHLLIAAGLIAMGFIGKKLKLIIGGVVLVGVSFLLQLVGEHMYPETELTARLAQTVPGVGFNFRFFYANPPIFISLSAICWFLGILMIVAGVAMAFARLMSGLGLRAGRITANVMIYVLLVVMSVIWLIPFICILLQSFRVESTWQVGYVVPRQWGFDNYVSLFETNFPKWYVNTFITALITAVLQTIIVLCMSYTLSRFRFKTRKTLMRLMLVLTLFPGMLTMIILYRVLADLGMTQASAVPGLILVYVASSGMGYYVSKGFFDTIPKSLDEAARVDGATRAQVLYKIILPLSKPIVIYTILTAFMGPWGDYVFARYISMNEPVGMNVAVGLYSWLSQDQIAKHYTHFCAGGVLVAIPVTVLFMCLQKYYVEGVTGGAVKG